jgi:hypothetical protein
MPTNTFDTITLVDTDQVDRYLRDRYGDISYGPSYNLAPETDLARELNSCTVEAVDVIVDDQVVARVCRSKVSVVAAPKEKPCP